MPERKQDAVVVEPDIRKLLVVDICGNAKSVDKILEAIRDEVETTRAFVSALQKKPVRVQVYETQVEPGGAA